MIKNDKNRHKNKFIYIIIMKHIIYKITIIDRPEFIYVGSTKYYSNRKWEHKKDYDKHPERLLYKTIRENGGWENAVMSPIEEYVCDNKIQSLIRERYWLETLQANMNTMLKPTITEDEKTKRETEYKAKWFQDNKERLTEKNKEYREIHKEEIIEKQKSLYQQNKAERIEKQRKYRENNLDIVKEKQCEKIACECGMEYTRTNKARHFKTKGHLDFINKQS